MALMMVRIAVIARLVDVREFGIYSAGLLVSSTFCMLACLGLQPLLQRDMPMLAARGRMRRPLLLTAQAVIVACACACVALLVAAARVPFAGLAGVLLAAGVIHGLSQQVFLVATVESRSLSQPVRFALQNLVRAGLVATGGAAMAVLTRSAAPVLAAEAAISLVLAATIFLRMAETHRVRVGGTLALAWRTMPRANWDTALVFLGVTLAASAVAYADRWFSASLLPAQAFAQYAFAGIAVLAAQSAQAMLGASVYPALSRRFAFEGQAGTFALSARVSLGLFFASAVLAVPAWYVAQFLVGRFYAAYEPALAILPLLLAVCVLRVSDFWSSFLMICGHERQLLATQLVAGGGACAGWFGWIAARGGAVSIADCAWLAAWLSAATYVGAAGAAWIARQRAEPVRVAG
jgi:O-antigen/teichoic acid export membrane protein